MTQEKNRRYLGEENEIKYFETPHPSRFFSLPVVAKETDFNPGWEHKIKA
jgi:hypothetical protein